jgi:hypothetical protein
MMEECKQKKGLGNVFQEKPLRQKKKKGLFIVYILPP